MVERCFLMSRQLGFSFAYLGRRQGGYVNVHQSTKDMLVLSKATRKFGGSKVKK